MMVSGLDCAPAHVSLQDMSALDRLATVCGVYNLPVQRYTWLSVVVPDTNDIVLDPVKFATSIPDSVINAVGNTVTSAPKSGRVDPFPSTSNASSSPKSPAS